MNMNLSTFFHCFFLGLAIAWTLVSGTITNEDKKSLVEDCVIKTQKDFSHVKWHKNITKKVIDECVAQLNVILIHHTDLDGAIFLSLNKTDLRPIIGDEIEETMTPNKAAWIFGSSVFIVFGFLGITYIMKVCCASTEEINLDDLDPEAFEALKKESENRKKKGHH
uniref:Uncharacterized protein n=1 Tax=Lepeophtheirus salmonis TaxID=72036 RepID=A0A0K2THP9_LEPSM